ncbi:HAMP domain-containing sensor histidine kinase [Fibrella sp. ES10-3-2-2]|nr:hypothetical protein A6C57_21465 [Fibrella sp. ES10-3-2-2]
MSAPAASATSTIGRRFGQLLSFLHRAWSWAINIGVDDTMDDWLRKRTRLVNGISVIPSILYACFALVYSDEAHRVTFWESLPASVISCVPILMNHYRRYEAACYFFLFFNIIYYTFSAVSHGAVDATEYYLITASLLPMLFFRRFLTLFLFFILNVCCFFLCKYSFTVLTPFLSMPNGENLYETNHLLVFLTLFLVVYYFRSENTRKEEELKQSLIELKLAQNRLIQREKLASLGELTAGIAHEIQNPLNFVNNFSELSTELIAELDDERLRTDRDPDLEAELLDDLKQNLQKINHHGGRASAIVKGMLEHSNVGTGSSQPADINALVDEYLHLAYEGQKLRNNSFACQIDMHLNPKPLTTNVVPQDIGRVLTNLFTNAFYAVQQKRKANPTDFQPTVTVSTAQVGDQIEISIRDNGTGISEDIRAKVFQPFFTTKPTGEGTGLGLSLSYDIITKGHNGTFTLDTVAGEFAQFSIKLPIV